MAENKAIKNRSQMRDVRADSPDGNHDADVYASSYAFRISTGTPSEAAARLAEIDARIRPELRTEVTKADLQERR